MLGMRVGAGHRKMPEAETQAVSHPLDDSIDNRLNLGAKRALVISVLKQRDRPIDCALDVVTRGIRESEIFSRDHFVPAATLAFLLCNSSSAERIPSAPGLTPIGET